jgi:hypothetical protein
MVQSDPTRSTVGSPAYFRSCGWCPTEAKGKILARDPIVV